MTGSDKGFNDRHNDHTGKRVSLAVSPDGRCIATATDKCDVALWDAETGTHIATLEYAGDIYSLAFLPDGHLASGNGDGEISVWDTVIGSRVRTFNAHSDKIYCLSASQSKLASSDKIVRVWDTATWECTFEFECDGHVTYEALYPNGNVAACNRYRLYVWDTATQKLIVSKNISRLVCAAVSNDGKWLAVVSDITISLYDADTHNRIWSHDRDSAFIS